jgi:ribosomal protein S9
VANAKAVVQYAFESKNDLRTQQFVKNDIQKFHRAKQNCRSTSW